jgi:Ca-activated chloride channel family protein
MKVLGVVLGCLMLWCGAAAQDAPPAAVRAAEGNYTVRARVDEVRVLFTATDKHHRPVTGLRREQISILDGSTTVGAITDFRHEDELPLRLGLLVDVSDSMAKDFPAEQHAAKEFFSRVMRKAGDAAFVISFDGNVRVAQRMTSDRAALAAAIDALPRGGMTALFDAVYQACSRQFAGADPGLAQRGIVLLSDGDDTGSIHGLDEAISAAERAGVAVYPIALSRTMSETGEANLQQLARATGGRMFAVSGAGGIQRAFAQIEDELRSQYSVAFKPVDLRPDGRFHPVLVRVRGANIVLHARAGYFAPEK